MSEQQSVSLGLRPGSLAECSWASHLIYLILGVLSSRVEHFYNNQVRITMVKHLTLDLP